MLTGDLNIAEVDWIVQYKIKNPKDYLFNIRDVENTIRDVSEATMRLMVGDKSFQDVLKSGREIISDNYIIDGVCCSPYRKDKCICSFNTMNFIINSYYQKQC